MSRRNRIGTDITIDLRQRRRRGRAPWPAGGEPRYVEERFPRLAVVRPVARTTLIPGTVVWAHIPYDETNGYKLRPAVVRHRRGRDVALFPATSSESRHRYPWAYRELDDLASAGLLRASGVHLTPITVDLIDVVAVAGELGPDDRLAVFGAAMDEQARVEPMQAA